MPKSIACVVLLLGVTAVSAQSATPPAKVVLKAKNGNVTFDHAAHAKREKNACKTCHPAIFTQSNAPIAFKPPHKNAEDKKISCGFCHRAGGPAFATKGNCTNGKCHVASTAGK